MKKLSECLCSCHWTPRNIRHFKRPCCEEANGVKKEKPQ